MNWLGCTIKFMVNNILVSSITRRLVDHIVSVAFTYSVAESYYACFVMTLFLNQIMFLHFPVRQGHLNFVLIIYVFIFL